MPVLSHGAVSREWSFNSSLAHALDRLNLGCLDVRDGGRWRQPRCVEPSPKPLHHTAVSTRHPGGHSPRCTLELPFTSRLSDTGHIWPSRSRGGGNLRPSPSSGSLPGLWKRSLPPVNRSNGRTGARGDSAGCSPAILCFSCHSTSIEIVPHKWETSVDAINLNMICSNKSMNPACPGLWPRQWLL